MKPVIKMHEEPKEPPFYHSQTLGIVIAAVLFLGILSAIILHKVEKK